MTSRDREDLIDFVKDHLHHFDSFPVEFETRDGEIIKGSALWEAIRDADLTPSS